MWIPLGSLAAGIAQHETWQRTIAWLAKGLQRMQQQEEIHADLAGEVYTCQHDVLWIVVQSAAAQVEPLEECEGGPLHFRLESEGSDQLFAELLHLGLVKPGKLDLILEGDGAQFLACPHHHVPHAQLGHWLQLALLKKTRNGTEVGVKL